ncbi:MAG TPA: glycosyltransferase family 87 protein [Cyclobacteriaceae bacterium]|nr:glycosyltransferase family 87 protein [Cyclobacteriaceae bacterium]
MRKYFEYLCLVVLIAFSLQKGIRTGWTVVNSDFANYYVSAQLVAQGKPLDELYNNDWFQQQIQAQGIETPGKFAPFPPITSWMLLPLTPASPLTAQRTLIMINLLLVGFAIWLLQRMFQFPWHMAAILVLASGQGFSNNLAFGQVYWIIAVCILFSLYLEQQGMGWAAGFLLGFWTSIKYIPVVFIFGFALLAWKDRVSGKTMKGHSFLIAAGSGITTLLLLVIAQYLFFGSEVMHNFIQEAFLPHLDGQLRGQGAYSLPFQSWDGLLRHWFVPDPEFNPNALIDWPSGRVIVKFVLLAGIGFSMISTCFRFRNSPHFYHVALTLPILGAMVLLPASATYHFILLVVPMALLLSQPDWLGKAWCGAILIIYVAIGFLPLSFFYDASSTWGIWIAYPRVWLVTSLYLMVVFRFNRISSSI